MNRLILCYRCKTTPIGIEATVRTSDPRIGRSNCESCKRQLTLERRERMCIINASKEHRAANANRMRNNNPMFDTKLVEQQSARMKNMYQRGQLLSPLRDPEIHKRATANNIPSQDAIHNASQRMISRNPMKNPEVVHRMSKTTRDHRDSGIIVDKRGQEHWLWKGNRDFNNTVRTQLYRGWVVPVMVRDGFRCVKCGLTNDLQVHHVRPLRWFLSFIKRKYGFTRYCDLSPEEKLSYAVEVVTMHKAEDGITVCSECHKLIDPYYRSGSTNYVSGSIPLVPYKEITQ